MTRRLLVVLFIFAVVAPAWAGLLERANSLFVEAVKLIQSANIEQDVEIRLEQLKEAQEILQRIIEDYPSSNLAVQLISGQSIGDYSLNSVRRSVAWAHGEVLEERARNAATKLEDRARNAATTIEDLLSQLSMARTPEVGEPLAEEVDALLSELSSEYGTTRYLRDLRSRFGIQRTDSLNTWASIELESIDKLITRLKATRTAEEGEPLVRAIEQGLNNIPKEYRLTSYVRSLRGLYGRVQSNSLNRWVSSWAVGIYDLITRLGETNTAEEGAPLISAIENKLDQRWEKFGSTSEYSRIREIFRIEVMRQPIAWSRFEAEPIDELIAKVAESKSVDDAVEIADAIKRLTDKYGRTRPLITLRIRFERALDEVPQNQWVLERLK